jgi:hypothetical protein
MKEQQGKPHRRLILMSALQIADDSTVSRGLIMFILDNTSTKRVITPKVLSSKCNMYWRKVEKDEGKMAVPCKADKKKILNNLTYALGIVLSNHHIYRKSKTEQLEAKLHGWRCSEGKRKAEVKRARKNKK